MILIISIHVPAWGTTSVLHSNQKADTISIHVPAWGTTSCYNTYNTIFPFQSTFPRGERRVCSRYNVLPTLISIHVPAWGTTGSIPGSAFNISYFNPRSRVGNDFHPFSIPASYHVFQSTFPRGERQQISTIFHLYICISSPNLHFSITSF